MPFDAKYRNTLDRDGKGKRGAKSCILPFFGYEYGSDTDTYTQGVYISDSDTLSGQRKVYGTHSLEVEVFSRKAPPAGKELELENQFIRHASNSGDPWKMPYIQKSLREFYDDVVVPPPAASFGCVTGIVLAVLWFLFYKFTFPPIEKMFGYDMGCVMFVFVAPIVICLVSCALGGIVDLIKKITKKSSKKYYDLTATEKNEVRQKYFALMSDRYGEKAGAALKEYAILKGYDR